MARVVGVGVIVHSPTPDEVRALLAEYNRVAEPHEVLSIDEMEAEVARRWGGGELVLQLTLFADLADGRRVVAEERDGGQSVVISTGDPDRVWTRAEIERTVREELFDDSPRERWDLLRPALRRARIFTRSRRLDTLPFSLERTPPLSRRLIG